MFSFVRIKKTRISHYTILTGISQSLLQNKSRSKNVNCIVFISSTNSILVQLVIIMYLQNGKSTRSNVGITSNQFLNYIRYRY